MLFLNCLKNPTEPVKSETVLEKGEPEGKKNQKNKIIFTQILYSLQVSGTENMYCVCISVSRSSFN